LTKVNARFATPFQSSSLSCALVPAPEKANLREVDLEVKVQLLVSESCVPCDQAAKVWRKVAAERGLDFSVVSLDQPEGRTLAARLQLKTIPALLVDNALVAIGVQSLDEARALVSPARS